MREVGADNLALVVDFYHRAIAGEPVCDFSGFEALIPPYPYQHLRSEAEEGISGHGRTCLL